MSGARDGGMRFGRVIGQKTLLAMGFGAVIGFGWVTKAGNLGAIPKATARRFSQRSTALFRKIQPA